MSARRCPYCLRFLSMKMVATHDCAKRATGARIPAKL